MRELRGNNWLTFSTDQKIGFAHSVDHNKLSHQNLHCLPFCSIFLADFLFFSNGFVLFQRWKSPLNLRAERVMRNNKKSKEDIQE